MPTRRDYLTGLGALGLAGAGVTLGVTAHAAAAPLAQPPPPGPPEPPGPPGPPGPPDPTVPPVPTDPPAPTDPPEPTDPPDPPDPPGPPTDLVLTARRTEITLPAVPTLGITYICQLDLSAESGTTVGTAYAGASVVGLTLAGPVVLAVVVLRLADGEIHYQRVMDRFGGFPREATGAILGGTGGYRGIGGEVEISWPDEERIDLVVHPATPSRRS